MRGLINERMEQLVLTWKVQAGRKIPSKVISEYQHSQTVSTIYINNRD